MQESKRISNLIRDLYNGHPWLEVTIAGTLNGITASKAAAKVHPDVNSIWEIVNHLVSWRNNVLRRVQGEVITTPANNYFSPVQDRSEHAWRQTLEQFNDSQQAWISFLENTVDEVLDRNYPVNNMSYYDHIHGIIHHDAYHLGQIVLLAKIHSLMHFA